LQRMKINKDMRNSIIIVLMSCCITFPAWTQSLDDYLVIAGENNPELKAYYQEYLAAMEIAPQVGSLPDPELSVGIFPMPMERFMGNQVADIRLMQMFPWFGMLATQKEEAKYMAQAKYSLFLNAKNQLFYQVKDSWYELYAIQEQIRISQENLEYLKKYETLALSKFRAASAGNSPKSAMPQNSTNTQTVSSGSSGMSSMGNSQPMSTASPQAMNSGMSNNGIGMSDVLRIRMQIRELESSIETLKDQLTPVQIKFNKLLNREIQAPIAIPEKLEATALIWDKMVVLDSITTHNPMLQMYESELSALDQQEKMARLDGRPMFGAGVNYMPFQPRPEGNMLMGGNDMIMPMVTMTLPIYRKKTQSRIKETNYLKEATVLRKERESNMLAMEWSMAIRDLEDANRKVKLYQEQTELANQKLNLVLTSFTSNGKDFEEVLATQQILLDYQLKAILAIVQQHKSLALLESLGTGNLSGLND
jgi:outer membrane protein TolC